MNMHDETIDKLKLEMRRGVIVLAVLAKLKQEHYGYSLRKNLEKQGVDIDEGTLYPLIRRLEKQGLLESEWREENKRKKRFYTISKTGITVLERLSAEWIELNKGIQRVMGKVG
jgi:PadR family transcriptional regulator PadR